jgi:hypothetical protein
MIATGFILRMFSRFVGVDHSTFIEVRFRSAQEREAAQADIERGPIFPECMHCHVVGRAATTEYVNVLKCEECGGLFEFVASRALD